MDKHDSGSGSFRGPPGWRKNTGYGLTDAPGILLTHTKILSIFCKFLDVLILFLIKSKYNGQKVQNAQKVMPKSERAIFADIFTKWPGSIGRARHDPGQAKKNGARSNRNPAKP